MEIRAFRPYFTVIGLMLLTSLALAFTVDVTVTDQAGIKVALPDHVGAWVGKELRFCQNGACQKEFAANDLADRNRCPSCGGPLDCMTLAEKQQLPPDTIVLKKEYRLDGSGPAIYAAIVLSGRERASIHRPQICLVGQGHEIVRSEVMEVPVGRPRDLGVMVLDMLYRGRDKTGRNYESASYYAYWFVGKGRETPSHVQRMIWMATDRIFHNVSHRWAYISVAGHRIPEQDAYREELARFIGDLYPQMVLN